MKGKSKEFKIVRWEGFEPYLDISFLNNRFVSRVCYLPFVRLFGIKLKAGEKKRIRITIEEL
jgi:hypothetical protein